MHQFGDAPVYAVPESVLSPDLIEIAFLLHRNNADQAEPRL
jgi:hypothetical protein